MTVTATIQIATSKPKKRDKIKAAATTIGPAIKAAGAICSLNEIRASTAKMPRMMRTSMVGEASGTSDIAAAAAMVLARITTPGCEPSGVA